MTHPLIIQYTLCADCRILMLVGIPHPPYDQRPPSRRGRYRHRWSDVYCPGCSYPCTFIVWMEGKDGSGGFYPSVRSNARLPHACAGRYATQPRFGVLDTYMHWTFTRTCLVSLLISKEQSESQKSPYATIGLKTVYVYKVIFLLFPIILRPCSEAPRV